MNNNDIEILEEQEVSFDTAVLAKAKGFNQPTDGRFWIEPAADWKYSKQGVTKCDNSKDDSISRPKQDLLKKWLRVVHKIDISIIWFDKGYLYSAKKQPFKANTYKVIYSETFEQSLEIALVVALNLI